MTAPTPPPNRLDAARTGPRVPLVAVAAVALVVVLVVAGLVIVLAGGDDGDEATTGRSPAGSSTTDEPSTPEDGGEDPEIGSATNEGDGAFGPVTVEGDALTPFEGGGDDPAVGEPAPTLVGEDPSGGSLTVGPGGGPLVVAFLAHWCPHCQAEVPRIVELADGADEIEGVPFVAVATGTNPQAPNFPPATWLDEERWPAPVLLDDEDATAAAAYGLTGYPFLVAVDGDGTVVARSSGELGDDGLRDFFAAVAEAD